MSHPPPRTKILIVEDEARIAEPLLESLQQEGFVCIHAADGPTGLRLALGESPDLILLDLMLPGQDGTSVCRQIRKESNVPILILTARDSEADKVLGLELGADDYVTKPFSLAELKARVRALLRRAGPASGEDETPAPIERGDLCIDPARREATLKGKRIGLTATEFDLLEFLARHPGRVFTREHLLESVWGYSFEGYGRTVDSHITRIRKKIEDVPSEPRYIETVYKVGYRFGDDP